MLVPKKLKHRKQMKGKSKNTGVASKCNLVNFGSFGLKSLSHCWVDSRQIEAARRAMTRFLKRGGKIWIRIFPHKPVSSKGGQMPMGSGKGNVDHYVAVVKPGMILFEMEGVSEEQAKEAFRLAAHKLPIGTRFVVKK